MKKLFCILLVSLFSCNDRLEPTIIVRGGLVNVTIAGYSVSTSKEFVKYDGSGEMLVDIKSSSCDTILNLNVSQDSVYVFDVRDKNLEVFKKTSVK